MIGFSPKQKNLKLNPVKLGSQPNGLLKTELLDVTEAVFGWDWIVNIHTIMRIINNYCKGLDIIRVTKNYIYFTDLCKISS